jgi:hypothetical protein
MTGVFDPSEALVLPEGLSSGGPRRTLERKAKLDATQATRSKAEVRASCFKNASGRFYSGLDVRWVLPARGGFLFTSLRIGEECGWNRKEGRANL